MTYSRSTPSNLPPGIASPSTAATTTYPSISSTHLPNNLPATNSTRSASNSSTAAVTPTDYLITTALAANLSLSSPPMNASQALQPLSKPNLRTFNSHQSNKSNGVAANTSSPSIAPSSSHHQPLNESMFKMITSAPPAGINLPRRTTHQEDPGVARGEDFTGPVVMPIVGNSKEVTHSPGAVKPDSVTVVEARGSWSSESSQAEESSSTDKEPTVKGVSTSGPWNTPPSPSNSSPTSPRIAGVQNSSYVIFNPPVRPISTDSHTSSASIARTTRSMSPLDPIFSSLVDSQNLGGKTATSLDPLKTAATSRTTTNSVDLNSPVSRTTHSSLAPIIATTPSSSAHLNSQTTHSSSSDVAKLPDTSHSWTSSPRNISTTSSSTSSPLLTSVSPSTPADDLSPDYQADIYDVFTEDYVTSPPKLNATSGNGSADLDMSSLRKKFLFQFTNMTNPPTSAFPNTTPKYLPGRYSNKTRIKSHNSVPTSHPNSSIEDPISMAASDQQNATSSDITTTVASTTPLEEITAPVLLSRGVTSAANQTKVSHTVNKEQLQFPGITLKVSHVLIPKQKRSRYNIQNMRIELPKTESLSKSPPSVPKTSKNSNCTRFPVLVVTAADTESKEKVNLTEERYDCEFSSQIQSSTQQKEPVDRIRTYYGGYVFRYTIPKASNGSNSTEQPVTEVVRTTDVTRAEEGDDYYPSYGEYLESANGSSNSGTIDDAIFPDPIVRNEKILNPRTEAYRVPLTESPIIDSDLHDRDVIDSVMYIYFGGASRGLHGAGSQVLVNCTVILLVTLSADILGGVFGGKDSSLRRLGPSPSHSDFHSRVVTNTLFQLKPLIIIVGAVIALVAQFLTLASSIRRIKTHQGEEPTIILLNVEIALTLTNLIFILGVQSPGNHTLCRITAVSLYYLHLVTLLWFLLSSLHCVQSVIRIEKPFKLYIFCICGWCLPLIIALFSYLFNERSFETSSYCWVSPLRGILFSYILPVIFLCSVCIVTTVYGLGRVTDVSEELDDTYSHRKLLRISAVSLPLFSIIWFTGMISLENSSSLLFSMIYLISNTVLNWLLFGCWLPTEASQWKDMDEDYYDEDEDFDDEPVLVKRRFDDQPLLSELYEYGAQGQLYNLRIEPISIISAP